MRFILRRLWHKQPNPLCPHCRRYTCEHPRTAFVQTWSTVDWTHYAICAAVLALMLGIAAAFLFDDTPSGPLYQGPPLCQGVSDDFISDCTDALLDGGR